MRLILIVIFVTLSSMSPLYAGPHHGGGNGGEEDTPPTRQETGGGVEVREPAETPVPRTAPENPEPLTPNFEVSVQAEVPIPQAEPEQIQDSANVPNQASSDNSSPDEQESNPRNYNPESCEWVADMPRRIAQGPSCGRTPSQICTGYVICNLREGEGRFIRMSTCSPELCGQGDAKSCTKDRRFFSSRPSGETRNFMDRRLRDVIRNGSSVRQE